MNKYKDIISDLDIFLQVFMDIELLKYKIGDANVYNKEIIGNNKDDDNGLNPFLKYEADVKVKLGSFLICEFNKRYGFGKYTINSEMRYDYLTDNPDFINGKIDLSLHFIKQEGSILWLNRFDSIESLIAGIEIKLLNYRCPDGKGTSYEIEEDIKKLSYLNENAEKYIIIITESDENITINNHKDYIIKSKENKIKLFTNSNKINDYKKEINYL